jgi:hypothetical protein
MKILKTDTEKIAKPATSLILLGVLKGYINNPVWFLFKSKITFKKYEKRINLNLPHEFVKNTAFIAWIYIRLKEKVGKEKAFEIVRVAVLTSGFAVQQANFRNAENERTFSNLIKFQQRANTEGSTKLNTIEVIEQTDKKYEFRVTKCLFFELFSFLNVPELTSIICSIDNAIFNSYLPEKLIFHRNGINNTIAYGKKYCDFILINEDNIQQR